MELNWGSMPIELLNCQRCMSIVEFSTAMADYIEDFYNPQRRHLSPNYLSAQYEEL
jgi:hypothetical protein